LKKTYILDTSVLVHDPQALFVFQDNDIIVPMAVIEEIDGHKKRMDQVGKNARKVARILDNFRLTGHLDQGVPLLDMGGTLRVELNHQEVGLLPAALDHNKTDNRIIAVALSMKQTLDNPVVLVTKDTTMRVKADALSVEAEDYETDQIDFESVYTGIVTVSVDSRIIDRFYQDGGITLDEKQFHSNQFVVLEDDTGGSKSALARVGKNGVLQPLRYSGGEVFGIRPRNKEQRFALELLLDEEVRLVTLLGQAGTGKTLVALAAGLQQVVEDKSYRRLSVSRPIMPMGKDLGYLPGEVDEKLRPWMQPIYDNLELLLGERDKQTKLERLVDSLRDMNLLELEALTYIRGRSIPQQFLLVDEAQNLSPHEVKTIITRVGEGTKIVLTGDPYQIDHPYLDANSNGLTYVAERFKDEPIAGHVTLVRGERSELAEIAAKLLL
jgi:PhoH-like ATPase